MASPLRVLLVGSRILPYRHAGDKNFWLDMIHALAERGHEVDVLSVTADEAGDGPVPFRYVRPIPFYVSGSRFNEDHTHLSGTNNYASKTLSLPRILRSVRRARRGSAPGVVHFADNYGPAMIGLRTALDGVPASISAPTYQPDRPLYDVLLRASFASFDVVVPFSDAYRDRLGELGMTGDRVRRIRWGVDTGRFAPPTPDERAAARRSLGLDGDGFVLLWTGFPQQTGEDDLRFVVRCAEALAASGAPATTLLCFKPEHYRHEYAGLEGRGVRVFGTAEAFHAGRRAADLFLAPITAARSTAAPPLAWLESLAMGIPIGTTPVPGGEEAVVPGTSGFVASGPDEAAERIAALAGDPRGLRRLREGSRELALERFSLSLAVAEHERLWSDLSSRA